MNDEPLRFPEGLQVPLVFVSLVYNAAMLVVWFMAVVSAALFGSSLDSSERGTAFWVLFGVYLSGCWFPFVGLCCGIEARDHFSGRRMLLAYGLPAIWLAVAGFLTWILDYS